MAFIGGGVAVLAFASWWTFCVEPRNGTGPR